MDRPHLHVLLVEDDAKLARLTRDYLEQHGLSVTSVADGNSAIREGMRSDIDVVVLDLMLPGRDGLARYARIKYPGAPLPFGTAAAQLAAALAVIALASMPLARSISAPVERLAQLARALGQGQLAVRARSGRGDEIGDLSRAFDEMADRIVALRRSEKELLANVSHELRTPLARMRLALELAREGDTHKAQSYLQDIEEDLAELEPLLDDI